MRVEQADENISLKKSVANFQRERNNVARLIAYRRARQLLNPSGALNFGEQMKPIWDRLQNDLAAAWFRLLAAAEGFQKLYDYPMDKCFDNSPKGSFNFDSLVTWCQNMNTWLASFLDTQQLVTRSFSIRQLLSEQGADFNAGLSSGKWRFKLKESHFSNLKLVRLRGLAVQIDSGHFSGSWNVAVSPPTKALLRVDDSRIKSLEQKVGTLYLGRVNETTYQVLPESAAPPKMYNASPIGEDSLNGEWGIEVLGMSTNEKTPSSILDIDIHLTVALV